MGVVLKKTKNREIFIKLIRWKTNNNYLKREDKVEIGLYVN